MHKISKYLREESDTKAKYKQTAFTVEKKNDATLDSNQEALGR